MSKKEALIGALFALLRERLSIKKADPKELEIVSEETLPVLYKMAKLHDVAHLLMDGLKERGLLIGETAAKLEKQRMVAHFRYEQSKYELSALSEALEQAKIPFIPLKGSILRDYYPEPWMRTSCDIDVLVKREDCDRAAEVLSEQLQYRKEVETSHDLSLFTPSGVHIELHYDLNEEKFRVFDTLTSIWSLVKPEREGGYLHVMPDEVFYFYHIAHMAKHFDEGGCGIRSFLDLWILDHLVEHDEAKRDAILIKEGMYAFAKGSRHLSEVWFSGTEGNDLTDRMQSYILSGGVYGTVSNRVALRQTKEGGRIRYALRRIFLPYSIMKVYYPILQKHKWLTPLWEVRRWVLILFGGRVKNSITELNANREVSEKGIENSKLLLSELGLN